MDQASVFSFAMSYCGPPALPAELWGRWNLDPLLLAGFGAAAAWGWYRLRHAETGNRWAFAGAWLVGFILFVSPFCALTVSLFSARVSHHVVLTMVVAPLLALALPAAWNRRIPLGLVLAASTIALWGWHSPAAYTAAFAHPAIYWAMQASLLALFTGLWLNLLRSPATLAVGVGALLSAIQMGLLGALLVFAPGPLYVPHQLTTVAYGLSPLEDQQLAGLIMWVPADLPLLALAMIRLFQLLAGTRQAARP